MALTIANKKDHVDARGRRVVECKVTFDNSYPTGGEVVTLGSVGLKVVDEISIPSHYVDGSGAVADADGPTEGYSIKLDRTDPTAPKLLVYTSAGQVADTTDLSGLNVVIRFAGS